MLSYDAPGHLNGQRPGSPPSRTSGMSNTVPTKSNKSAHVNGNGTLDTKFHHIWLVTGPAGCGKTTVAEHLATSLKVPYVEGDNFHPQANIDKMANGIPLTDADRWDWLTALREESRRQLADGSDGVVLTCSALKRKYRDVIRVAGYYDHSLLIHFIYLNADESVLLQRVQSRQNHYMGANMVSSQFSILEPPQADERDVISVDVSRTMEEVKRDALSRVTAIMEEEQ
ncbi:hypothetical protein ACHAQA_002548 [Verticillium albo-atrum]